MKDFRNLKVWEKSHGLTLAVYDATKNFPRDEQFGLTSQIRRSCASIPANIAEGCGKATEPDFARDLQNSFGSACELEYHLILAGDLRYLDWEKLSRLQLDLEEIKKMLASLISKIRSSNRNFLAKS